MRDGVRVYTGRSGHGVPLQETFATAINGAQGVRMQLSIITHAFPLHGDHVFAVSSAD